MKIDHSQQRWLVTGAAGFIGSHLVERLLKENQVVVGVDNFSTGHKRNLEAVLAAVGEERAKNFRFVEGDISQRKIASSVVTDVDIVLHQAALGSVPRSLANPSDSFLANVQGFVQLAHAAAEAKVKRFVYASSSAVYGDALELPKRESKTGKAVSPYALTKAVNEQTAELFHVCYGLNFVGLRYFNVFGARQDPNGAYAAVIPLWIKSLLQDKDVFINGDGNTTRDFCYVENVVQANLLAALSTNPEALNKSYNISCGEQTSLKELYQMLASGLGKEGKAPIFREFRKGDINHSLADISLAQRNLGYKPLYFLRDGLKSSLEWYSQNLRNA